MSPNDDGKMAMPGEPVDWRQKLDELKSPLAAETYARLADVDLRVQRLPQVRVKDSLNLWLNNAGLRVMQESESEQSTAGPPETGDGAEGDPLAILEEHVDHVVFVYKNFRPVFAFAWLFGAIVWVGIIIFVWLLADLSTIDSSTVTFFTVPASIWLGVFIAGLAGSAINVLGRVYTPHFEIPSVYLIPRRELTAGRTSQEGGRRRFTLLRWLADLIYQIFLSNLLARVFFESLLRAIARPFLGGFFAVGVFLILSSGLIVAPLVEGFAGSDGVLDFTKNKAVLFFLSVSFIAGFSDELAFSLMGRAISAVSASRDQT